MALNLNVGYHFKSPAIQYLQGSVILASAMPIHQLTRRELESRSFNKRYPHMQSRLFDPQLYLAELDVHRVPDACVKLASYPWFDATLKQYISDELSQNQWRKIAEEDIANHWTGMPPVGDQNVANAASDVVDFQMEIGCRYIVLASPLTKDPSTTYEVEISWLEHGLARARDVASGIPVYATVALQDLCLNFTEPRLNKLLDLIADQITARGVDGVYLVIEQGSEQDDTRNCGSTRTLHSVLRFVHMLSQFGGIKVFVNSLGAFGLACLAAGASEWATGWYKSLYRVRIADLTGAGRVFPSYWSTQAATDIHLESDFDLLVRRGLLGNIETVTAAATGLHTAAHLGLPVARVPEWEYRPSNRIAASEHFLNAVGVFSHDLMQLPLSQRLDQITNWLNTATATATQLRAALGAQSRTKLNHVGAWANAFANYRRDHNL